MGISQSTENLYCKPIPGSKKDGQSEIYRHIDAMDGLLGSIENFSSLQDIWQRNFTESPNQEFLGKRPLENGKLAERFEYLTFSQLKTNVDALGSGLLNLNLVPTLSEWKDYHLRFVAIYSKNSQEYIMLDGACVLYGLTSVPIYDTLGEEACEHMFTDTNLTTLCLTCDHISGIVIAINENRCGKVENLVIMDEENFTMPLKETILNSGKVNYFLFSQVMENGRKNLRPYAEVKPDDIYTFSYTSGTTAKPKGTMLSHKNILVMLNALKDEMNPSGELRHISYLPMAHIFERMFFNIVFYARGKYGIFNGNVQLLSEDLFIMKPTIFVSVPRLYNKFYDGIKAKTSALTGMSKSMFEKGLAAKMHKLTTTGSPYHFFWDRLIFNKMKARLGGCVELMLTASAPIDENVLRFQKCCFCCPIQEAYGQTEGTGGEFCTAKFDNTDGHVGGVKACNEFVLRDVPAMSYLSTDKDEEGNLRPRGEICVRGANVFPGYYKNQEKTDESKDSEGWLMSGDIGIIIPGTNALKLIDRKKNIFKLSQGEYVAPEKIEQTLKLCPMVADIFVHGDSQKPHLIAIIHPEDKLVEDLAKAQGITGNIEELCNNEFIISQIRQQLDEQTKISKLKGFERIKDFYLCPSTFESLGVLTTTMKVKRNETKEHFEDKIKMLYGN